MPSCIGRLNELDSSVDSWSWPVRHVEADLKFPDMESERDSAANGTREDLRAIWRLQVRAWWTSFSLLVTIIFLWKLVQSLGQVELPESKFHLQVNINSVSAAQLESLPEVGPTLAKRIVSWREQNGQFRSLSDLQLVPGVGEATAESLAPWLVFSADNM